MLCLTSFMACRNKPNFDIATTNDVDNATLIVLAYPEEIVRTTPSFYSDLLPYIGMGIPGRIRAGHACMVLVKEGSDTFEYYDFGRYITPENYSRARSASTDPETTIDIKARWDGKHLTNLPELLQWLYDHPEKTRGVGDLYASMSEKVNYERVKEYVQIMQSKGIMKYGPFVEEGSNCARFVTDAMYHGILDKKLHRKVRNQYLLTPSGLGNVGAANSDSHHFVVSEDSLYRSDKNLDQLQRSIIFDFGEGYGEYTTQGGLTPPKNITPRKGWQWLAGIGSGAWFSIKATANKHIYAISHINAKGLCEYNTFYESPIALDLSKNFEITYPSNFKHVSLAIEGKTIMLERIKDSKRYENI